MTLSLSTILPILTKETPKWAYEIVKFLTTWELPCSREEVRKVKNKVARFTMVNDTLYKRGFKAPLLRCISRDEAPYFMEEVHKEIHKNHSGRRALAAKVMWVGY
ncbi:hypothetical protein I3843_11G102800 [Carya illinoinensis]|nr:hypothetical protein I3843_11G102800 [Carya illinoinensis]